MSLQEILNARDLEQERIIKTTEKIRDSIAKENFRMVQKYKESLTKMAEKWEGLHLQVANLKRVGTNDPGMKQDHRNILDIVEKATEEADIYYNELKIKKKEERRAEKEKNEEKVRMEEEQKRREKFVEQKPIMKELFVSEIRETTKIVAEYAKKIEAKKPNWVPELNAFVIELKYLENRFGEAIKVYDQLNDLLTDPAEINRLRDIKNTEERKFRADFLKLKSFANGLSGTAGGSGKQGSAIKTTPSGSGGRRV